MRNFFMFLVFVALNLLLVAIGFMPEVLTLAWLAVILALAFISGWIADMITDRIERKNKLDEDDKDE